MINMTVLIFCLKVQSLIIKKFKMFPPAFIWYAPEILFFGSIQEKINNIYKYQCLSHIIQLRQMIYNMMHLDSNPIRSWGGG